MVYLYLIGRVIRVVFKEMRDLGFFLSFYVLKINGLEVIIIKSLRLF